MILYLNFEELAALESSARDVMAASVVGHGVIAPPRIEAEVEQFAERLDGEMSFRTMLDQQFAHRVVRHLLDVCRVQMDDGILIEHPAAERAVAAYFNYAHVRVVEHRLGVIGDEMASLVRLMTGEEPDSDEGRRFSFPE